MFPPDISSMSNPVGAYVIFDVYEQHFRNTWLREALSPAEYLDVSTLSGRLLRDLYPAIYSYGPRGFEVGRLLEALDERIRLWGEILDREQEAPEDSWRFFDTLGDHLRQRPTMPEDVIASMRNQMRPKNVVMRIGPAGMGGHVDNLRRNHGLIKRLAGRVRNAGYPDPLRQLEELASDAMLLDQYEQVNPAWATSHAAFLDRWGMNPII